MANRNTVGFGLNATGTMGSNYTNQGQSNYFIDAADATAIYNGQPVKITSGYIVTATAAITNSALGVFNGCFYNAATTQKPTWNNYYPGGITPANSEDITAFVLDNPFQLYEASVNALMGATQPAAVAATIGQTMGTQTAQGSTTTGKSSQSLVFATIHATANTWRVLRVAADPENEDMTAAWCTVVVVSNLNQIIDSAA